MARTQLAKERIQDLVKGDVGTATHTAGEAALLLLISSLPILDVGRPNLKPLETLLSP